MYLKTSGFGELHEKRYQHIQIYGIMSAERTLYLRIPVCAFTAQIRAHKHTVAEGHGIEITQIFYGGERSYT